MHNKPTSDTHEANEECSLLAVPLEILGCLLSSFNGDAAPPFGLQRVVASPVADCFRKKFAGAGQSCSSGKE